MLDSDDYSYGASKITRQEPPPASEVPALTRASAPQAALEVTTLVDVVDANDGLLSLREAITAANDSPDADTITFADAIRGGTIALTANLPTITDDVVIDGDPLDGGASGIVIDGGLQGVGINPGFDGFTANGVDVGFEDLTIQDTYSAGIDASASNTTLDRVEISGVGYQPIAGSGVIGDGSLKIADSVISGVGGEEVGYGVLFSGDVALERSTIENIGGYFATGMQVTGDVWIADSTFANIAAPYSGEAVIVDGSLQIENSSFLGNGTENGFRVPNRVVGINGELTIVNSTFAGNASGLPDSSQPSDPHATIYLAPGSTGRIVNTTVTGTLNTFERPYGYSYTPGDSPIGTGLLVAPTSQLTISNSIIDDAVVGTITSNSANTFRDPNVDGAVAGDQLGVAAKNLFATTEEIATSGVYAGVAANNGGPTETVALLDDLNNTARNAADPADAPATDQRGFLRDATPDIGAFELEGQMPTEFVVTTLNDVVDVADGVLSLREAVDLANRTPGENSIAFADSLRGGTITLATDLGTLAITDDLAIDGDPLDGGAGGIAIDGLDLPRDIPALERQVIFAEDASLTLEDLALTGGTVILAATDSALVLDRVTVGQIGDRGGYGIDLTGGSLHLRDSLVANSSPLVIGIGIGFEDAAVTIENSTIEGWRGTIGQAIAGEGGSLDILASTIANNYSPSFGRTIGLTDVDLTLVNSTLALNQNDDSGGSALEMAGGTGLVLNSTLTGNLPTAIRVLDNAQLTIANSIVDGVIDGQIASNGANLFGGTAVDGAQSGDELGVTADQVFAQTQAFGYGATLAGVLADNGGPTQTVALLDAATNPALDAADPADAPPFDQRGLPRDATPDIGSFELEVQPPPNTLPPLAEKVPLSDSEIVGAPLFLVGASGDAAISFVDEVAAFQSSLGVYLVGPDGTIGATEWVFDRIEHSEASDLASAGARPGGGPLSPGDTVLLSDLFAPEELAPGTGFGLFLAADGWALNDAAIFDAGSLAFRSDGGPASVTDTTPDLVHIAANGSETLVLGDILHTIDAGSANPLSNTLNPGGTGQVTSGLLDGAFTVAFEDKPLNDGSDRDFNDALFAVDAADTEAPVVAQASYPSPIIFGENLLTGAGDDAAAA